jgi:hypothetical protein
LSDCGLQAWQVLAESHERRVVDRLVTVEHRLDIGRGSTGSLSGEADQCHRIVV